MYHVYLLESQNNKSLYVGYTKNIEQRLRQHNAGLINYTKKYTPWKLIYYEAFLSSEDAKVREKALKSFGRSFTHLKRRIKNSLNNIE